MGTEPGAVPGDKKHARVGARAAVDPGPSPSQSLNSYSVTSRGDVCDTFTRIGADLTANTGRPVVARRCKGTDGVWRDR